MKSCVIVFLSLIITCNAALNYTDFADHVVSKLLKHKDPLDGMFDILMESGRVRYQLKETKFYDWKRLEVQENSVQGLRLTRDTHDVQFVINLPSPIIKGKLYYTPERITRMSPITAISSLDISFRIHVRINEFYSETAWKSVELTHSLEHKFVSQFECQDYISLCEELIQSIDGKSGAWDQPFKLLAQVKQLVYNIKYF